MMRAIAEFHCDVCGRDILLGQKCDHQFRVGDGITVAIATDAEAYTVIAVSPNGKMLTCQRDKVTRLNRGEDTWEPGGFVAHQEYPDGQEWSYERDPDGRVITVTWRELLGCFKLSSTSLRSPGFRCRGGRREWYDYNF